ncbi:ABC transporter substrate-binding protein [Thermodesulfobacteriota bacterium]
MKLKKSLTVLLAIVMIFLFAGYSYADARGVTEDSVKLGLVIAVTGPSGVLAKPLIEALQDYFGYINDQGGVNGRKISMVIEDDQNKAPKSVAAVNKLIHRDKVLTIMTTGGSNQTIANFKNIEKFKITNVPNGLMDEFYEPYKKYVFPYGCPYNAQFRCMVDYLYNDLKVKNPRIGVVYAKKEYGKLGLKATRERVEAYGGKLACELVLPLGSVDASSQVLTLQKNKVDYVITCLVLPAIVPLLKTYQKYNYNPKATFGFVFSMDPLLLAMVGDAAKSYIGATFMGTWTSDDPGIRLARELAKKNNRKIGLKTQYLHGLGYGMIFVEAIKRAGKNLNPDSLQKAFETFRNFETGGIWTPLTYTSKSHKPPELIRFFKPDLQNKNFNQVTDWRGPRDM